MAGFRLGAHVLEVETLEWRRVNGARSAVPRAQRTCGLGWHGLGDEMHMVAQCDGYTAVRQRHPHLFTAVGGWQHVTDQPVAARVTRGDQLPHVLGANMKQVLRVTFPPPFCLMQWAQHHGT